MHYDCLTRDMSVDRGGPHIVRHHNIDNRRRLRGCSSVWRSDPVDRESTARGRVEVSRRDMKQQYNNSFVQERCPPCLQMRPTRKLCKRTALLRLERCHWCRARTPSCPLSAPSYPADTPYNRWNPWCWSNGPWGTCYTLVIRSPRQTAAITEIISSSGRIQERLCTSPISHSTQAVAPTSAPLEASASDWLLDTVPGPHKVHWEAPNLSDIEPFGHSRQ